jgi:hypothetical protein
MMEVRRRKKSGEVFWASLSLSPLRDLEDRPVGLIAYLTDITERKLAEERLHHLAYYQELTGLPNRTLFARLVDQALMVAQRNEATGCVLYLDLNRFKLINGTLGRTVGDELLRQVAALPQRAARRRRRGAPGRRRIRHRPVRHPPALRGHHGGAEAAGGARSAVPDRRPRPARGRQRRHQRLPAGRRTPKRCCAWPTSRWRAPRRARGTRTTASPSTAST